MTESNPNIVPNLHSISCFKDTHRFIDDPSIQITHAHSSTYISSSIVRFRYYTEAMPSNTLDNLQWNAFDSKAHQSMELIHLVIYCDLNTVISFASHWWGTTRKNGFAHLHTHTSTYTQKTYTNTNTRIHNKIYAHTHENRHTGISIIYALKSI